jgi:hypothetical protein
MFHHHSLTHRTERAPTAVELWAQREAKSPTMAADLLTQSRRRSQRPTRYAALLAIIAVSMLVTYLIR